MSTLKVTRLSSERFVSSERKVPRVACQLKFNQADVCVCMSGRAPIQSGRRGFESLAGSVLDEAQYNQAYEVKNELHTIKQSRYIIAVAYAVESGGYIHVLDMKQKHFYVIK